MIDTQITLKFETLVAAASILHCIPTIEWAAEAESSEYSRDSIANLGRVSIVGGCFRKWDVDLNLIGHKQEQHSNIG